MSHFNRTETASIRHTARIDTRVDSPSLAYKASSATSEKKRNRASEILGTAADGRRWTKTLRHPWALPQFLQWIPANFTWENLKPVIRCAVAAWISVVFFVIPAVANLTGQTSFLVIIAAIMSPPTDPFMSVLERELLLLLLSTIGWAWCCLGMFLAHLARHNKAVVPLVATVTGKNLETGPTVIIAVWIFIGSAVLLYLRASQGPGPYLSASVLVCISIGSIFQSAVLFPFPFYLAGRPVMISLALHSGISLLCSIFIFPQSISSQFTRRLQDALVPVVSALDLHQTILKTPHDSPEFISLYNQITAMSGKSEDLLISLRASARLLKSDLVYSRFAPNDFVSILDHLPRQIGRLTGMAMYFGFLDPTRERFPVTPMPSLPASPTFSRSPSPRRHSPERGYSVEEVVETPLHQYPVARRRGHRTFEASQTPTAATSVFHLGSQHSHSHSHPHHPHFHSHHSSHLHYRLLHLKQSSRHEHAVGMFETQKYLNLEATHLHIPLAEVYTRQALDLVQESCEELLSACHNSTTALRTWLGGVLDERFSFFVPAERKKEKWQRKAEILKLVRDQLRSEIETFRAEKRHLIVEPYKQSFETTTDANLEYKLPPHRYLFYCYVYQYHLMLFGQLLLKMLDAIIDLDEKRQSEMIWTPAQHLLRWDAKPVVSEKDFEEDPDHVEGMEVDEQTLPQRRDPDALPPSNFLERISDFVYQVGGLILNGNLLYAVKAGLLTVLMFFPYFFKSSAEFAYGERFIWAIFMGQLTLSRFRGDTTFVFLVRIIATFLGGLIGMVIWYIAAGKDNRGSPYGLAAVFAVCLPLFFYTMQYWPVPPLTHIIMFVTAMLVIGFSYQDARGLILNPAGVGFTVAWRRFVLVVVGVTIAFFVSFLPPSTTIRKYHRKLLATTSSELGSVYCQVISFANSKRQTEVPEIATNILAIRRKLRKCQAMRQNVGYEFSFRGKWPAKRYFAVLDIQSQIAIALSHLMSTIEHLDPSWSRAFLRRTRFDDTNFQGDILAVITMISTALRTGHPLPQITPCPLLDRSMLRFQGLEVIHKDFQDDCGLPQQSTLDTLKDEQYMAFCVGVSTAFNLMTRLDRLMLAAKEIVGEQYYIHGLGFGNHASGGVEMRDMMETESIQLRAPGIV